MIKITRVRSLLTYILRFTPLFSFILLVSIFAGSFLTAETIDAKKPTASPEKECFIKPLSFFNELSWKEAVDLSSDYHHALDQFDSTNWRMLKKYQFPGLLNPPVKNEDAMIVFLGYLHSPLRTEQLTDALLDKINQKQKTYYYAKNRYKLFCREKRPAFHALYFMGPNVAHQTLRKIGQETDKEKRYYMAKLLWKVLGKKFALLYLEDQQEKTTVNDEISAEEKTETLARYNEAIAEVKQMPDKVTN